VQSHEAEGEEGRSAGERLLMNSDAGGQMMEKAASFRKLHNAGFSTRRRLNRDLDLVQSGLYAEKTLKCAFIAFSQIEQRFHKSETVFL